jgi:IrrE N-terminal-like domain
MSSEAIDLVRDYLRMDAARLRAARIAPVDVEVLARALGLRVRFEATSVRRAPEATLVPGVTNAEIVLFRNSDPGRAERLRERFTLAHEIGHYCVLRRFNVRPRTRSEYWRLEQACDDFAGRLLVDDDDIDRVAGDLSTPKKVMSAIRGLGDACEVSFPVAAHRLVDRIPSISVCRMIYAKSPRDDCLATVKWCWEDSNDPWLDYGQGRFIGRDSIIGEVIENLAVAQIGASEEIELGGVSAVFERYPDGLLMAALSRADCDAA